MALTAGQEFVNKASADFAKVVNAANLDIAPHHARGAGAEDFMKSYLSELGIPGLDGPRRQRAEVNERSTEIPKDVANLANEAVAGLKGDAAGIPGGKISSGENISHIR